MKYYAIIVAGGSGSRMQQKVAKQFLLLAGKPILMHTITAFANCELKPQILLVLNAQEHQYWEELCKTYGFDITHQVILGGEQRFHSVKNGLDAIEGDGIVAIHDAVRPLVSKALIMRSFLTAEATGNAVAGIPPTDSVRQVMADGKSEAINRNDLVLIQTPQSFHIDILKKAYQQPYRTEFTDDASVAEYSGFSINLIEGSRENIKITYPEDLQIAAFFLNTSVKTQKTC